MTCIVYSSKAAADAFAAEIAATPIIEGGVGAVWLWFNPDVDTNDVTYAVAADGRCAQSYPFDEATHDWLAIQAEGHSGVTVTDSLPADWEWPEVE